MNRRLILIAVCVLVAVAVLGGVAFTLRGPASEPHSKAEAATDACQLSDSGGLEPVDQVRFVQRYPDPFGAAVGVHLGDTLNDSCALLVEAGFVETYQGYESVALRPAASQASSDDYSRFTDHIQMDGAAVNPFEGASSKARVILHGSSPATYSSVERIIAHFHYSSPPTLEEWVAQMIGYFGKPSGSGPTDMPPLRWVVSGNRLDVREPGKVCDRNIVDFTANPIELPRTIDRVPPHGSADCQLLIIADFLVPDDTPPGRIGATSLDFIDFASIALNRQKENEAIFNR